MRAVALVFAAVNLPLGGCQKHLAREHVQVVALEVAPLLKAAKPDADDIGPLRRGEVVIPGRAAPAMDWSGKIAHVPATRSGPLNEVRRAEKETRAYPVYAFVSDLKDLSLPTSTALCTAGNVAALGAVQCPDFLRRRAIDEHRVLAHVACETGSCPVIFANDDVVTARVLPQLALVVTGSPTSRYAVLVVQQQPSLTRSIELGEVVELTTGLPTRRTVPMGDLDSSADPIIQRFVKATLEDHAVVLRGERHEVRRATAVIEKTTPIEERYELP